MERITTIIIKDGSLQSDVSHLPDGSYILYALKAEEHMDVGYYQRLYGALKNTVYKEGETGYKPSEIHQLAKSHILPKLEKDTITNFDIMNADGAHIDFTSTKHLSLEGWRTFVEEFRIFSQEQFHCYI